MRASLLMVLSLCSGVFAQTSFPMITHLNPVAVQRGTSSEVTVEGQMNFAGAYKVLFNTPGITAEVLPIKASKAPVRSIKLKITVSKDAPLGVADLRIASNLGLSSLGQLLIVADPVYPERVLKPGSLPEPTPLPAVVCGRIKAAEAVDFYRFSAKVGERITLEVHSARLQDKIHDLQKHADPLVAVFDATGRELAANDDGYFADPLLHFTAPADGLYTVQIRDAKYDGDPRWSYALSITNKPSVSQVYPFAGTPNQTVTAHGYGTLAEPNIKLTFPTEPGLQSVLIPGISNPVALHVTNLPLIQEGEPNSTNKEANRLSIPGGVNGQIQERRDLDYYLFKGEKGRTIRLEVFARRFATLYRSRADLSLDLMTADGKILASNDDTNGKDPQLIFTPPADGEYLLRVRELNSKGGEGYAYYLEATDATPDFSLRVDPCRAMIGPGSRTVWFAQVTRLNGFSGPVRVEVRGLPPGVTVNPLTIPANMTQGSLVLSAKPDAKLDARVVEVIGTAEVAVGKNPAQKIQRLSTTVEEIYLPGGGRGRFDGSLQAVAVTEPSDILDVAVPKTKIVLKPGQEITLPVTVKRRADYTKPITLDVMLRHLGGIHGVSLPPGVTLVESKSKTLLGSGSSGTITLKAAADAAECQDVPIAIQAFVPINFVVKIGYSSEPIFISVKK